MPCMHGKLALSSPHLVLANLAQRHGARAVAVGLLDAAGGGCALARGLGGQLLAGRLAARRLARRLLGAGHRRVRGRGER